jgi:hypothetical protein
LIFCLFTPTAYPACHPVSPSNHSPSACLQSLPVCVVLQNVESRKEALRFPLLPGHSPLFALAPALSTPSRPRSLALALHLSDARSVFSSCRSLLSGLYRPEARSDTLLALSPLPRALTSRLSPLARAFASVPCRSRLFSPFLTNLVTVFLVLPSACRFHVLLSHPLIPFHTLRILKARLSRLKAPIPPAGQSCSPLQPIHNLAGTWVHCIP